MTHIRPLITISPKIFTEVRNSTLAPSTTDTSDTAPAEQEGVVQVSPNIGEESFFTWNLQSRSVPARSITPQTRGANATTTSSNDLTHSSRSDHQHQGTSYVVSLRHHHQQDHQHQQKTFWSQSQYETATEMNAKYLISLMKKTDLSRQAVEEIMPFPLHYHHEHDNHQQTNKKARSGGKKKLRRRGRTLNITNKGGKQQKRRLSLTKPVPSVVYVVTGNSSINHSPLYKGTSTKSEVSLLETMSVIQETQHYHHKITAAGAKRQKSAAERPPHDSNTSPEEKNFHKEDRVESRSIYSKRTDNHYSIAKKSTKDDDSPLGCFVQHTNLIKSDYCHYHNQHPPQQSHKSLDTNDAFDVFFTMSSSNLSFI